MKDFVRKLQDPELDSKSKIDSSDNFELVYLRHKYFRRSSNPEEGRLLQFEEMICNISDKIYSRNFKIFKTTGMEIDDLRNIGRVNTISFISMSGLKENPDLMELFIKDHKHKFGQESIPTDRDIFLREAYNLGKYLNQRLHEVARFCEIKNTNIIADKAKKHYYVGPENTNPESDLLIREPERFGYKKITKKKFIELEEKFNSKRKESFSINEGKVARVVNRKIDLNKLDNFYSENCYNHSTLNPEDILLEKENLKEIRKKLEKKRRNSPNCKAKKALDLL